MKLFAIFFFSSVCIIFSACSSLQVTSDKDPNADFSSFQTYKLMTLEAFQKKGNSRINQINQRRIENAIHNQLQMRGLSTSDNPDVYVVYAVNVDLQRSYVTDTYTPAMYGGWGWRYYPYSYGPTQSTTREVTSTIGELTIALVETGDNDLVWYATGKKELQRNPSNPEERINDAVAKIMRDIPVGSLPE